jgi:hypothetical protein
MPEQLWRKETHHFQVKIKVGESWVLHCTKQTESTAMAEADVAVRDSSVSAIKVEEHALTHVCSLIFEDNSPVVLKLPPKLTPTGGSRPCPRCTLTSQVATDGTNEWIFCGKCESAFPG